LGHPEGSWTNVLAYAEGVNGADRKEPAVDLLSRLPQETTILPVQVLGELLNVLVRKADRSRAEGRTAILSWQAAFQLIETSSVITLAAADFATNTSSASGIRSSFAPRLKPGALCCSRRTFRKSSPGAA
jgi:predicted nucleic acid-binding protein